MSFSLQSRADRFHKDVRFSSSEQTPRPPTSASCKRDRPRAQLPRPARAVHAFCFAWVWVRSGQSQSACVNSARRLEPSRSHDRRIRAGEFQATVNARSGAKRPYSAWPRCAFQCRGRLRELDVGLWDQRCPARHRGDLIGRRPPPSLRRQPLVLRVPNKPSRRTTGVFPLGRRL